MAASSNGNKGFTERGAVSSLAGSNMRRCDSRGLQEVAGCLETAGNLETAGSVVAVIALAGANASSTQNIRRPMMMRSRCLTKMASKLVRAHRVPGIRARILLEIFARGD